jgi:DNA polymerase-3 subunit epsilon
MTVMSRQVEGFAPTGIIIDPFVIDRAVDPYRKGKRTLSAMCEHYGVRLGNAHEAEADALAAARLAWILRSLPALQGVDVMEWQANQHAERQASFAEYLTRQGKSADDVCGDWPIRNRTEEKAA